MKRTAIMVGAMLVLTAASAAAQVNLYVNDCGAGSSISTVTNACTSNAGTAFTLFGSMIMPAVTRVGFVGELSTIDVQTTSTGNIEDWWRGDACRGSSFVLQSDAAMGGTCPTLWDAVAPAGNNVTCIYGSQGAPANRIRFLLGTVLDATNAYNLTGDGVTETSVFKFTVLNSKTVGTGACAGCSVGACILLAEIDLETLTDDPGTFLRLTAQATNNHVNYNAFPGALCPAIVPVRNRTWGSVKALYR